MHYKEKEGVGEPRVRRRNYTTREVRRGKVARMKVIVINCGSSTLKFQFIEVQDEDMILGQEKLLASGTIDRIGGNGVIQFTAKSGKCVQKTAIVNNHGEASRRVLGWLSSIGLLGPDGLEAVGHRVVHGGDRFVEPVLIDDEVMNAIATLGHLAPLHNGPSLEAIRAAREALGPYVPQVATFDTTFHRLLPERASHYAIPYQLAAKHNIRRYGFHGLAHRYMTERYATMMATPLDEVKIITLQLGNGCSATAVAGGCSVDTSMGLTPLEGLMMGTRSGDIDPSLAVFLAQQEDVTAEEVENWLNTKSGLLGVSGCSRDMRELLKAECQGDARAALAVEMFCYRVKKYIGSYLAALGGASGIVFGGGIGENTPEVRARILAGMEWCGLELDEKRNVDTKGVEGRISTDDATLHAYVIPVNEATIIARDTVRCLRHNHKG